MKEFTVKRVLSVLLGMFLPVAIIIFIFSYSTRHSYLAAADSFGMEFGQSMAQQAQTTVQLISKENWNTLSVAAAALPSDFSEQGLETRIQWLKNIAASNQGRGCAFLYYGQNGQCLSSEGTVSTMHYTSRSDISTVLSGASDKTMYGPVYDGDSDSEDAVAADTAQERSGYVVYYNMPIKDASGIIQGVLSLRRDAYEYCDAISDLNLGEGGYTYVLNAEGTVIAVSSESRIEMVNKETNLTGQDTLQAKLEAEVLAGTSGSAQLTKDDQGGPAFVVYMPVYEQTSESEPGWGVMVYLPQSELQGYMTAQANRDVFGALGSKLSILLLVLLFAFYLTIDVMKSRKQATESKAMEYRDILNQTLRALSGTIDARNVSGKGHGYRVAAYARELGEHLDLSAAEKQKLYFEAALHDVGMVAVSETVLQHQDEHTLTAEEGQQIRKHVTVGGRILGQLTDLPGINVGAMYHQQYYDGTGYCSDDVSPAKGEDIPLEARIITVADAYDEMVQQGHGDIDLALERGKGKHFDPLLADIMIQLIRDGSIARIQAQTEDALRNHAAELTEV